MASERSTPVYVFSSPGGLFGEFSSRLPLGDSDEPGVSGEPAAGTADDDPALPLHPTITDPTITRPPAAATHLSRNDFIVQRLLRSGIIVRTDFLSAAWTPVVPRSWRLRFVAFLVRM